MTPRLPILHGLGLELAIAPGLTLADLPADSIVWRELLRAYFTNPATPGRPVHVARLAAGALLSLPHQSTTEWIDHAHP